MPRKRDDTAAARAAVLYAEGCTAAEIGAALGVTERTVRRWLSGRLRGPGPRPRTTAEQDALILELRSGHPVASYEAIAAELGMSKTGARMRHYALTGHPRPERMAARPPG